MLHSFIYTLALLASLSYALPLHFHKHDVEKRQVITRVHTASTTNTVTDFYSTTTRIVVAPTVEFIISGTATFTTTLFPEGVDPTVQPTATLTTVLQMKDVNVSPTVGVAGDHDSPATSPVQNQAPADVSSSTDIPAPAETTPLNQNPAFPQPDTVSATTAAPQADTVTATTAAPQASRFGDNREQFTVTTPELSNSQPTESTTDQTQITPSENDQQQTSQSVSAQTWNSAIDESVVYTSAVSQPPAQVHTESSATPTTTSSTTDASQPQTTASTSTTSPEATQSQIANSGNNQLGGVPIAMTYSPYNSDGSCRSADNVYNDLNIIKSHGVSQVRIYGTDCNSLQTVQPACAKLGIKINQGLWIDSTGVESINNGINEIIEYSKTNGWDIFEYITIGNEAIISGFCSVSDLISKIQSVKAQLKSAGYQGSITTSEPPVSFENHPELCTSSGIDFVGVNPHSYFNTEVDAAGAGAFVEGQVDLIKKVCGTSNVVVTETGYPSKGMTNGKNVPSTANQKLAIESILSKLNNQVTILSYFNDMWKNPGPYGIEQSFGTQSLME